MKFLTEQQERVFTSLTKLANGNTLLVERALQKYGSGDDLATISDIITFIKNNLK
jgi:hypothetical protein